VFVALAPYRDEQTGEQTEGQQPEQQAAIRHGPACSARKQQDPP
jgi:hypothetical protein